MGAVSLVFIFSPGLSCDTTLRSEVMMRGRLFPHALVVFLHLSVFITMLSWTAVTLCGHTGWVDFSISADDTFWRAVVLGQGLRKELVKETSAKVGWESPPWPLGRITWRCLLQRASHSAQAWQPHRD